MMRRAAIDVGTNSVRLLVADVPESGSPGPAVRPVDRELTITRLGESLHDGGVLTPAAVERTVRVVETYVARAATFGAPAPIVAATYAVRVARNPEALLSRVSVTVRVLSGEEEAALGFRGAVSGLSGLAADEPLVVLDVGGGSVEVTWGTARRGIEGDQSLPVGSVVMTRRAIAHDPPVPAELSALAETLAAALDPVVAPLRSGGRHLIGVGGTVTTLAAMAQRLTQYDPDRVHGYRVTADTIESLLETVCRIPLAERRRLPGLQPERADVIIAGTLAVRCVMRSLGSDAITASEADLLWALVAAPPAR
ncbi:MAG TPA: Ppx/GppA phosphatase family protein [bacterium]|nr:Ppx/GppA phosphatase family protein [bacterium]